MSDEDERLVEVMSCAAYEKSDHGIKWTDADDDARSIVTKAMRAALSALRAEGCEVVRTTAQIRGKE